MTGPHVDPGAPADPAAPDLPLHLWRRLDWRFLLPSTRLRVVACGGTPDDDLLAALRLLQVDVVRPGPDWRPVADAAPDVVVLVQPTAADLAAAAAAVRPGGWVYAEVRRDLHAAGPRTLLGWPRAFRAAGLTDVVAHWHAPDLRTCSRMVPLDAPALVRDALSRHGAVRFGRALSLAGRAAVALGVFPAGVPEGSTVGRRPEVP
ncbi:hypothetical protein SAMN05660690_1254 [Geodermatophilus telluris]|uniref:Methyltransferase domain-containing protein n=1 Tax=Geodermatophilus telluris TaxID=1190417 RepID=A0A1G6L898_9ACTN|nr:hypothetical protein [Geodermatophilus telluris]SDC39519.1 hypothetical protein SAMN05660690_1254 [Geodermatophilus telluris]